MYDHGILSQFADTYASRRDGFIVAWERENPPSQTPASGSSDKDSSGGVASPSATVSPRKQVSVAGSSTLGSSGDTTSLQAAQDNIRPSLKNIKPPNDYSSVESARGAYSEATRVIYHFENDDGSTFIHEKRTI